MQLPHRRWRFTHSQTLKKKICAIRTLPPSRTGTRKQTKAFHQNVHRAYLTITTLQLVACNIKGSWIKLCKPFVLFLLLYADKRYLN